MITIDTCSGIFASMTGSEKSPGSPREAEGRLGGSGRETLRENNHSESNMNHQSS